MRWRGRQDCAIEAAARDRIAPRMYAIERAEPPPKITPHILTAWGLTPLTDPSGISPLDDHVETPGA